MAPNIMALKAESLSKKGEFDKALEYIRRSTKLAEEVLNGVKVHKKYINILFYQSEIYLRKKKNTEALDALIQAEELGKKIFLTHDNLLTMSSVMKRAHVMSEQKEQEFQAEDLLKQVTKMLEKVLGSIKNREDSLLGEIIILQQMTVYFKIHRADKIQKIHNDLTKSLEAKGLTNSSLSLAATYFKLQCSESEVEAAE